MSSVLPSFESMASYQKEHGRLLRVLMLLRSDYYTYNDPDFASICVVDLVAS